MAPKKLTEYERKRLENIRRNDEMMAALRIHSKASQLSAITKRQRIGVSKLSPEKKKRNIQTDTPVVTRRSLRTRGMPPDSQGLDMNPVDSPVETPTSPISQHSPPRVMGPISTRDAYSGTGSDRELIRTILSFQKKPQEAVKENLVKSENFDGEIKIEKNVSPPWMNLVKSENFDGEVKIEKKEIHSRVSPWSMNLKPENTARVMAGRIMVVRFLPYKDVNMIVAGNKFGNLAFWNVDSKGKEEKEDGIFLYRPHTGPISGISFQQASPKIFTSCYDGFLRLMDVEKEVFDLVYSCDDAIFSLSRQPNEMNGLYFGEGRGGLNIWDVRAGRSSSHCILHEDRINSIDFNSQNPNIMATSSTDGTACLWDLRSVKADKAKHLKIISHNRAVHSAYFSPSGSFLATTSPDDTVGILSGVNFEDSSMIHHCNQTGRWISSFRGIWGWDDSYIFIGNMKRGVDVVSRQERRTILTLESPHVSAIPCRFDANPHNVGMLAGATGGGQVYVWTSS